MSKISYETLVKFSNLRRSQKQLLAYYAAGNDRKKLSTMYGVSDSSIGSRLHVLRIKLGHRSNLEMALWIVRHPEIERMLRESL